MLPHQWVIYAATIFLAGNLFGVQTELERGQYVLALAAALVALVVFRKIRVGRLIAIGVIFLLLGALRFDIANSSWQSRATKVMLGTQSITGHIMSLQIDSPGHATIVMVDQQTMARYQLEVWDPPTFAVADRLTGTVELSSLANTNYQLANNIHARGSLSSIEGISPPVGFSLHRSLWQIRESLSRLIDRVAPAEAGALLKGLLLGTRTSLSDEFREQLSRSGTTHIVALSGFNITLVITFLAWLFRFLPKPIRLTAAGVSILIFIIMTGLAASVVRAAAMGWLLLLSGLWGRKIHLGSALAVAAASMVAIHPHILCYDIGFQLSVMATAGLVVLGSPLQVLMPKFITRLPLDIGTAITATLAATATTLPVTTFYFGGLSAVSLFSNAMIVPLIPIVMIAGSIGTFLGAATSWSSPLLFIFWSPAKLMIELIQFWGGQQVAFIEVSKLSPYVVVAWYAGIALFTIRYAHLGPYVVAPIIDGSHAGRQPVSLQERTSIR